MKGRLLIVGDERGIVIALKGLFTKEGYEVENAGSGEEALDKVKAGLFPVIINELSMKKTIGLELLPAVKTLPPALTVLIRGESGTGKELVARAIHFRSPRSNRPFIAVNCAAFSRELVESELFGHEKGAFTGAVARREGKFEAAAGGTLFLDEIGDMGLETQAKLLRVLQEKQFERIGGNQAISVDVRIIAATNQDLETRITQDRFREDLYYRIKVVEIRVPPLRERREDIPQMVQHFVKDACHRFGLAEQQLAPAAMRACVEASWRGNARALKSTIEQAVILSSAGE